MSDKPVEQMSFEEAMAALEDVVKQLESGEVPLDESIRLYERGGALKAHCAARLKEAEEEVTRITLGADGKPDGAEPVDIS